MWMWLLSWRAIATHCDFPHARLHSLAPAYRTDFTKKWCVVYAGYWRQQACICELQVRHWWLSNLPIFCAFCLPMFEYMNWISSCRQMLRTCGMIGTVACWGRNESMKINSTEQDSKRCGRWMATCSWSGERGGLERRHKLNFLCLCALVFLHIFQQEHWEVESKCAIILVSFHSDTSWLFKMSSWFSLGKKKNRSKFITAIHIPSCLYVFYRFP